MLLQDRVTSKQSVDGPNLTPCQRIVGGLIILLVFSAAIISSKISPPSAMDKHRSATRFVEYHWQLPREQRLQKKQTTKTQSETSSIKKGRQSRIE